MSGDDWSKVIGQLVLSLPATLMALAALIVQWRRERNKPRIDQSIVDKTDAEADKTRAEAMSLLATTLASQGKSTSDLTKDFLSILSELPQLKSELRSAQSGLKKLEEDLRVQVRRADFFISFARDHWMGSRKLHAQVVKLNVEPPEFVPAEKFPTGPLQTGNTTS